METNLATNSNRRVLSRKLGGADPSGTIWTSGFRRLAEVEAMLHARARARSSSHSFCMVFSVNLEIRPILSLISLSLLAVVLVGIHKHKLRGKPVMLELRLLQGQAPIFGDMHVRGFQ